MKTFAIWLSVLLILFTSVVTSKCAVSTEWSLEILTWYDVMIKLIKKGRRQNGLCDSLLKSIGPNSTISKTEESHDNCGVPNLSC